MRAWIVVGIVSALVAATLVHFGILWPVYPSKSKYPVLGIDVSHHQGDIDWRTLAHEGVQFAYIKATEGGDWVDSRFIENWNEAHDVKMYRGAYHYFTFCRTGAEQAENFIRAVPDTDRSGTLPPVADLEFVGNCKDRPPLTDVQSEIRDYLERIEQHYGRRPVIYTTREFRERYLHEDFDDYEVWMRSLFSRPELEQMRVWQYHSRARIDGIDGPVDLNVFNGDQTAFWEWADR